MNFRREGSVLVVRVAENPIINRLAFEGNRRIDDETCRRKSSCGRAWSTPRPRFKATPSEFSTSTGGAAGFAATVEPKVIPLDQNRVDLVFEIKEGEVTEVRRIVFVGNENYSDGTLRGEILTTESAWYRFFSTSDTYDPDRITVDREALRNFYLDEGYVDFRVVSSVAELSPGRDAFFITFTLEEGERYRFGKIDISSSLKDLDPQTLEGELTTDEGDWYDQSEVDKTVTALTERISELGYAFVEVEPIPQKDTVSRTVGITYQVREGPAHLCRADRHSWQRPDLGRGYPPGVPSGRRRCVQQFEDLPYTSAHPEPWILQQGGYGNAARQRAGSRRRRRHDRGTVDRRTLVRRRLSPPAKGPLGDISIRERNLLGRGQDLKLAFTISGRRQQLDFSFTEPYFLDKDLVGRLRCL